MFDESIKFKYPWRPYQAKALEEIQKYIYDGKVNIVAAPGSGKTVLGLELARRLNNPVLIVSPTVTIKNQWISRFIESFMEVTEKPDWISDNIYELKYFNSVTYQGLHTAYKKLSKLTYDNDTDDIINKEEIPIDIDVKTYDLIEEIKKQNIKTIILDEAHHLKRQWWNSLTKVIENVKDVVIISLTATPPYDVEYNEWKRYTSLCGEIDVEISVPELVKAKNLCPHQDYIYFSHPTKLEKALIKEYQDDVRIFINDLKNNIDFVNLIKNHKYIIDTNNYIEEILENPKFYSSMLVFLNSVKVFISKEKIKVLGHTKTIPNLTVNWVEILLQNILFNAEFKYLECIIEIEKRLKKMGSIDKKNVIISNNNRLQKYFLNSISKIDSITEIVKSEYLNLQNNLRMVILTDFIRKEYIEIEDIEINKIGVFSIFRNLLQNVNIDIAILTGSIFVIPINKKEKLIEYSKLYQLDSNKIKFETLKFIDDYCIVKTTDKLKNKLMSSISKLFSNGDVNIIIGTKSLLGEGWDEPCINSLVLASFIGSYVLSNQMRGRAIRVSKNTNKTANIWHLVCVEEIDKYLINNSDYETMQRRFNSFVGIGYNEDAIESGIDRLGIPDKFTKEEIDLYNTKILKISSRREEMYNKWFEIVDKYKSKVIEINDDISIDKEKMKTRFSVIQFSRILFFIFSQILLNAFVQIAPGIFGPDFTQFLICFVLMVILLTICNIELVIQCIKGVILSIPKNKLKYVGKVVVRSLCEAEIIDNAYYNVKVKVYEDENKENPKLHFIVNNVTSHERTIIINCLEEIFSRVENQRYILINKKFKISTYYNVPNVLSVNRRYADIFYQNWCKYIGKSKLIYTKSLKGRNILLKARIKTFNYTNIDELFFVKKKLSDWE